MKKNNHSTQLLLRGLKSGFSFKFSAGIDDLYINNLSQEINYGWENYNSQDTSKSITLASFNSNKTSNDITLSGLIHINTQLGCGLDSFTKFKNIANIGEIWYLIDGFGKKLTSGGNGLWYVNSISINSSDFITGLNALKISFNIKIKKYS